MPKVGSHSLVADIIDHIKIDGSLPNKLLIVDKGRLEQLLAKLDEKSIRAFFSDELVNTPKIDDPKFFSWIKSVRGASGLSQRAFARKLDQNLVSVSGSDIGNLETCKKLKNYSPERLEKIRKVIAQFATDLSGSNA